jgi:glyoxylase-like metal-dependent hydrolase (beta-lactamase superfamily II)/rhodanese-related sulfurtransferase
MTRTMELQHFYLGCLAQGSYLVGDRPEAGAGAGAGECAIIDPRRDVDVYIDAARERGLRITHVIETHLHADFVSGHLELARRTGATIHIGHRAGATFPHVPARDGDELRLGQLVLRFLETPGHTPESLCVLAFDRRAGGTDPVAVFTGDTLFIGDVGRPDLVSAQGHSAADMAGMLFDSLRGKLLPLPDAVIVYPAHGPGSACGKNIGKELSSTLGQQKALNWALQPMPRERFIALATAGLPPSPRYFSHDAEQNRAGATPLADLPAPPPLSPQELQARQAAGALVLDVRDKEVYGAGHVPGSINIGLVGSFAPWAGALLALDRPLLLVADTAAPAGTPPGIAEARLRLSRVGLHDVAGYLEGGIAAWRAAQLPLTVLPQLTVDGLRTQLAGGAPLFVLDVRAPGEHEQGHVPGAVNIPLPQLEARLSELDRGRAMAVICAGAYRSSAACGLLERAGFRKLFNVAGGTAAWVAAGFETARPESAARA